MSADNGIYILDNEGKEFRVCHAQAIENIEWSGPSEDHLHGQYMGDVTDFGMKSYWGNSKIHLNRVDALKEACDMEASIYEDGYPLEYGISFIRVNRPFPK